jgi:hypothetical protein
MFPPSEGTHCLHLQDDGIQWHTQEFCLVEVQQIQLRTGGNENGDLGGGSLLVSSAQFANEWQSWAEFPVPMGYASNNLIRIRVVFLLGCYRCIFHGTGNSAHFFITSDLGGEPLEHPSPPRYTTTDWIGPNGCSSGAAKEHVCYIGRFDLQNSLKTFFHCIIPAPTCNNSVNPKMDVICYFKTLDHFTAIWNRYAKQVSPKKPPLRQPEKITTYILFVYTIITLLAKCNSMPLLLNLKYR